MTCIYLFLQLTKLVKVVQQELTYLVEYTLDSVPITICVHVHCTDGRHSGTGTGTGTGTQEQEQRTRLGLLWRVESCVSEDSTGDDDRQN
jgi:hypothetical protein